MSNIQGRKRKDRGTSTELDAFNLIQREIAAAFPHHVFPFGDALRDNGESNPFHVFSYICSHAASRTYLLKSVNVCSQGLQRRWFRELLLKMNWFDESFPMDLIEHLAKIYCIDEVRLHVGLKSYQTSHNEIGLRVTRQALEITCPVLGHQFSNLHLSSILLALNNSLLIPSINVFTKQDFSAVTRNIGIGYYFIEAPTACRLNKVKHLLLYGEIKTAQDLVHFVHSQAYFPNVKDRFISLRFSNVTNQDHPELWISAFRMLGKLNGLACLQLDLNSLNAQSLPIEEGLHELMEATNSLEGLILLNYRKPSLNSIAFALMKHTDIERLMVTGRTNYDKRLLQKVVRQHLFSLEIYTDNDFNPDFGIIEHYCALNRAGRHRLLSDTTTKRDVVQVIQNAMEPSQNFEQVFMRASSEDSVTSTLYGLLRIRPALWATL